MKYTPPLRGSIQTTHVSHSLHRTNRPCGLRVFALISAASLALSTPALAITINQALGYVDVTTFSTTNPATPNNSSNDDSIGIQAAIDYAIENRLAVFFPPGVYHIENTINLERDNTHGLADDRQSHVLIGSTDPNNTSGLDRPKIKLKDNRTAFGSTSSPKAVILCRQTDTLGSPPNPKDADNFNNVIRNLIIDLGNGNPGAVGIDFKGAEGSAITDVQIYSSSEATFYAGLQNLPGSGGSVTNLEVTGGQYGVLCPDWESAQPGPLITAARFVDQTVLAVKYAGWTPLTMVGIEIEKPSGPVIELVNSYHKGSGALNLVDASIDLTNPGTGGDERTVIKHNDSNVHLRNVYVNQVSKVIDNTGTTSDGDDVYSGGSTTWRKIPVFADGPHYAIVGDGSVTYKGRLINGSLQDNRYPSSSINAAASAPTVDFLAKHGWTFGFALPDRAGVISVTDSTYGATPDDSSDDSTAIQNAINAASAANSGAGVPVILPAGEYIINTPLQLKWNTEFFGVGRNISILNATGMVSNSGANIAVLKSNDGAGSNCAIADFKIYYPPSGEHVGGIYWRAGENSKIRDVWVMPTQTANDDEAVIRLFITGNGGGRIYNWQCNQSFDSLHPDMRNVKITNTTEPLTFYMFHNQHIAPLSTTKVEVDNCENIAFYSVKQEIKSGGTVDQADLPLCMYFKDCTNIQITTVTGNGSTREAEGLITFLDCDDYSLSNTGSWGFKPLAATIEEFYYARDWETSGGTVTSTAKELASIELMLNFMLKGTPDFTTSY